MARLPRVSTPEIVACNIACNIAAAESCSTYSTNCCVKHVALNIARNVVPCVPAFSNVFIQIYFTYILTDLAILSQFTFIDRNPFPMSFNFKGCVAVKMTVISPPSYVPRGLLYSLFYWYQLVITA